MASAGDPAPLESGAERSARAPRRDRPRLLNTRTLGAGIMSIGAGLAAQAAFAPAAEACWDTTCRTYVSHNANQNSREYGPSNTPGKSGYISENHAHYNVCVQMLVSGNHYLGYHCGYSPYYPSLPTGHTISQGLAWRTGGGCGFIWGRENGSELANFKNNYGLC
jgi:hypothetical protein